MSDESRNVLVVTFEDSAEIVKVSVGVCVWCVRVWCVRVFGVCVCMCVHTCIHVCLCVVGVGVGVSAYMHACVCGESREPLFLPCSFSCVGGSEGVWLITQHYCTFFSQVQFLTVKLRSDQGRSTTTGSASSLPRCGWHCKGVYICMCTLCVCGGGVGGVRGDIHATPQ